MIYEEKTVKKTLVEDFNLYQKVIDALPLPISYRDRNGVYQTCNTAYEKMTGITREKMVGKNAFDVHDPEVAEAFVHRDAELLELTTDQVYEARIKASDGTTRDIIIQKAVIFDDAGDISGTVGSIFDVTERKKSEQKLEKAKESMIISSHMLHKIRAGIIIVNSDYKVIDSNESFATLMGDEIIELFETIPGLKGADVSELVPEVIYKMISNIMTTGEANLERDLKYQNRLLHISVVTIYKQRVVGAVIRDMSAPVLVRDEIISRAERVNKQNIETVQKIAYLLGENAAQTEELINSIIESYRYSDDE
ncbi:MAG: PAS domain S-box protein [Prolixibacteraceae bacterium]|jgi:PAS domain S-box-containing protein|nr:PAS domain S-box protein [Prolixibacteraceae bacterium]MDI9563255.1 PAS domain S-box protein [Bacteroidota bacterium]NLS99337.1 PAS domain S-box protein [Bacteroidales bacterium]OQB81093.1 MAG: Aerobic respiration control sensor protein ArcB [Bacteroidetes bacterium ADurb.Bin123]HNU78835.1 PAS domain S-box protein [Prolixibacteraceae bacterium]